MIQLVVSLWNNLLHLDRKLRLQHLLVLLLHQVFTQVGCR